MESCSLHYQLITLHWNLSQLNCVWGIVVMQGFAAAVRRTWSRIARQKHKKSLAFQLGFFCAHWHTQKIIIKCELWIMNAVLFRSTLPTNLLLSFFLLRYLVLYRVAQALLRGLTKRFGELCSFFSSFSFVDIFNPTEEVHWCHAHI